MKKAAQVAFFFGASQKDYLPADTQCIEVRQAGCYWVKLCLSHLHATLTVTFMPPNLI